MPEWMTLTSVKTFRNGGEVPVWRCSVELDGMEDFFSRTGDTRQSAIAATMNALHDLRSEAAGRIDGMAAVLDGGDD